MTAVRWLAAAATVAVLVLLFLKLNEPMIKSAQLVRYHAAGDEVVITVARGACETVDSTKVQEGADTVRVSVLLKWSRGTCTANIVFQDLSFKLASPLAGRAVFDAGGVALPTSAP